MLSFAVFQIWVCGAWCTLCGYTKLTFHLHHAWHSCLVFIALWCGCSIVKLTFYLHQTPSWLWLVRTNSPVFTPPVSIDQSAQQCIKVWKNFPVDTNNAQTLPHPNYCRHMHQVHEYPDSTISKVLTILKMWIITTLNCWKSWEYRTILLPTRYVHIGHFFLQYRQFYKPFNLSIFRCKHFALDWKTDRLTKPTA